MPEVVFAFSMERSPHLYLLSALFYLFLFSASSPQKEKKDASTCPISGLKIDSVYLERREVCSTTGVLGWDTSLPRDLIMAVAC